MTNGRASQSAVIIDDIYSGIRFPQRWPDIVRRIGEWLDADIGMMLSPALPGVTPMPLFAYGLDLTAVMAKLPTHLGRAEFSKRAIATGRVPGAFLVDELMPPEEQATNAFWQDLVAPLGVTSGVFSMVRTPEDDHRPILLNYYRVGAKTAFTSEDVGDFHLLLPHLRRALGIIMDSPPLAEPLTDVARVYDAIGAPCFLCALDGSVVYQNPAAQQLIANADGITIDALRLRLWDAEAQRDLDSALKRVVGEAWSTKYRIGAELLARRPSGGPGLVIIATPVGAENPLAAWAAPARCVIFVIEEKLRTDAILPDRLQRLYGLTKAEANVAIGIASGTSPRQLATLRDTKVDTIRTQLKSALSKTGARSQAHLSALVNRLRL